MNDDLAPGRITPIATGVRRLLAPNASPMTGPGSNTYIVGDGPYAVVDPAVDDDGHIDRLRAATDDAIDWILLTHRHPDHAGGAQRLTQATGARIAAWPKARLGEHDVAVAVDHALAEGEHLTVGGQTIVAHHTPGHAADHVAFALPDAGLLLAGDTLMTDLTVVILPPDGSMSAYFDTLDRLAMLAVSTIAPGHGRLIREPAAEIARVIAHRREREADIAALLTRDTPITPAAIVARLYAGLDERLRPVAETQVRAHLLRLAELGRARAVADGWLRTV